MEPDKTVSPNQPTQQPGLIDLSNHVSEPNKNNNNVDNSCSSSTASTDSSDGDDFFQLDPLGLGHAVPSNPIQTVQFNLPPSDDADTSSSTKSTLKSQSPPLPPATTVRNDVPDPYRIPSSVFARTKSTTPMDWSVASNESLFSITMGNSSFSRDHVFLMGRSGDLTNFSGGPMDNNHHSPPTKSGELTSFIGDHPPIPPVSPARSSSPPAPSPLPLPTPVQTLPTSTEPVQTSGVSPVSPLSPISPVLSPVSPVPASFPPLSPRTEKTTEATNAEAMKDVMRVAVEERESDKDARGSDEIPYSKSVSRQSDGSVTSFQSFAFPILAGDEKNSSIKVEPEHQRMQPQHTEQNTPKIAEKKNADTNTASNAPAATGKGWFSCFPSCGSSCC